MVPLSAIASIKSVNVSSEQKSVIQNNQMFSVEDLIVKPTRLKCDEPNCTKEFLSERKLLQHKNTHKKESRVTRPSKLECPVKSDNGGSMKVPCGRIFTERAECKECERSFFWAVGLRAHQRCHETDRSVTLVCPWPGCGRAFRQPCRLREHSRAHTGDKPYP
ncbi:unnamed protein product [Leptidea sinapis]|uniref:C2H2-type domain-containing protein n=1 Tax=Leptidea sinapis TaxID=189913 RepID=A0A5E4QX07_9NEOP|nr:unnamed protein product [Leptidea sinapis]